MNFDDFILKLKEETYCNICKKFPENNCSRCNRFKIPLLKLATEYKQSNSPQDIKQSLDNSNSSIVIDSSKGVSNQTEHSRDIPEDYIQAKQDDEWLIIGYKDFGDEENKYILSCKNKKLALGAVKIMLDNFDVAHIDVMNRKKFENDTECQAKQNLEENKQ